MAASMTGWLAGGLVLACAAAVGLAAGLLRARRRHRLALEQRAWLLARERESAARKAVEAERTRIARELHDIVSHNVSLMVVQTAAAREVLEALPAQAAEALGAVETAGRDAMTELRHLLGLLAPAQDGTETEPAALAPQPGLDQLSALVDRFAFAGLPTEVRISGPPRPLPAGIDLTAYRIIQEALTNALRHGADGGKEVTAEVTVRYAERYLRVEVLNSGPSVLTGGRRLARDGAPGGPPPGAGPTREAVPGRGLLGLRERVAVYGGDLDARRRLGGGYRVRAKIPLPRP